MSLYEYFPAVAVIIASIASGKILKIPSHKSVTFFIISTGISFIILSPIVSVPMNGKFFFHLDVGTPFEYTWEEKFVPSTTWVDFSKSLRHNHRLFASFTLILVSLLLLGGIGGSLLACRFINLPPKRGIAFYFLTWIILGVLFGFLAVWTGVLWKIG